MNGVDAHTNNVINSIREDAAMPIRIDAIWYSFKTFDYWWSISRCDWSDVVGRQQHHAEKKQQKVDQAPM